MNYIVQDVSPCHRDCHVKLVPDGTLIIDNNNTNDVHKFQGPSDYTLDSDNKIYDIDTN